MVADSEVGERPWVPLAMKHRPAIELDDKTCQARQRYGAVVRIDRGHIRLKFRLSFKLHLRRVHHAANQRTIYLQMGIDQDVVEDSTFDDRASARPHMHIAQIEVAWSDNLGDKPLDLSVLSVAPHRLQCLAHQILALSRSS